MMMALVLALTAIRLGQLNPVAFDLIDSSDVDTIGADYFHMLFDFGHSNVLLWTQTTRGYEFRSVSLQAASIGAALPLKSQLALPAKSSRCGLRGASAIPKLCH